MENERIPFWVALADTIEVLLSKGHIGPEKKEAITEKRINDNFSKLYSPYSSAPSGYADILKFLYEEGELSEAEFKNLSEIIDDKDSWFKEHEAIPYFWTMDEIPNSIKESLEDEKGKLSSRTMRFLSLGAEEHCWHQEYILTCKDLKAQLYKIDEAQELLEGITGGLTQTDLEQLEYSYRNFNFEMDYRPY